MLARIPLWPPPKEEPPKKTQSEIDLDDFFKAMGWTDQNGYLPRKPLNKEKKEKKRGKHEIMDLTDVHKDLAKTNVDKEMGTCILNGIETKREVKIPSEREAHRQRKVNIFQ